jgi:putative ABC transport system permease protein
MRVGERIYHALLFCYPREFRDEYGPEMELLFRERSAAESPFVLWLHLVADVGITAPRERIGALMNDLAYAMRMIRKNPGFAALAILALALGIGVNSAMFSIIDSILLRNLPFKQPDKLAMLWQPAPKFKLGTQYIAASKADFRDWKTQNHSFESLAGFAARQANLSVSGRPESVHETLVTGEFFSVLGVPPLLGAPILNAGQISQDSRIAVLSYRCWKSRFNGDRSIVGKTIRLDGENYKVIGVMPESFRFPQGNEMPALYGFPPTTDIWAPIRYSEAQWHDRDNHTLLVIGRLKPGVSLSQAQADLENIQHRLMRLYPQYDRDFNVLATPLIQIAVGSFRTELWLLFAAVGFVLLIACANVANLLLSRATVRRHEIAMRMALGATRARLYRQLLTESVFLSLLGAAGGLLLASGLLHLVLAFAPGTIPRLQQTALDTRVVLFAIVLSFVTGILFGIAPAFQMIRRELAAALQEAGGRGQAGTSGSRLRKILLVSEVALAMVLLVGAGLALRSFLAVEAVNPGFRTQNVTTRNLVLPAAKYRNQGQCRTFFRQALQRVRQQPGIERAGLVSALPLSNNENFGDLQVKGKTLPGEHVTAQRRWASEGYFGALGIPLLAGRYFEVMDGRPGLRSAVVNEAVARRFFPRENPIGQQVAIVHSWLTIVGVIGDLHDSSLEASPRLQVYMYYALGTPATMSLVVRSPENSGAVASSVRSAIASVDPDQAVAGIQTMDQLLSGSVSARRFGTAAVGIFAFLALLLTVVGLYGVVAYNVAQRSKEIAVRIALGAMWGDVVGMVLREALVLTGAGVAIGTVLALIGTRFAGGFIYGIPARDPVTFCGIAALLLLIAAAAAFVPARRAAATDPNVVLRYE